MALETRPIPELTGQAAIDFYEKVKNFTIKETREELLESIRWGREIVAKQRKKLEDAESKR
ncbi:MAG: hypothetical protein LBT76_07235, partial [Tannerella sp.]|nr:hypothetical protein [Tannerella sp.]